MPCAVVSPATKALQNNLYVYITTMAQPFINMLCANIACVPPSDFGVERLVEIAGETEFPWLMSNVRDRHTGRLLAEGRESLILEWEGRKVWCAQHTS